MKELAVYTCVKTGEKFTVTLPPLDDVPAEAMPCQICTDGILHTALLTKILSDSESQANGSGSK